MKNLSRIALLSLCLGLVGTPMAQADVVSTFDFDGEGWGVVSFANLSAHDYSIIASYTVNYQTNGGASGGYISSGDPDSGDFAFSAPAKFLGSKLASTGLTYSLTHEGGADYNAADVILSGSEKRLVWTADPVLTPVKDWMNIVVSFTPSSNWHVNDATGSQATAQDFNEVLSQLTGLFIRGEYRWGSENTGIDNVNLATVPLPAALPLFAFAVGGLALGRKRKTVTSKPFK